MQGRYCVVRESTGNKMFNMMHETLEEARAEAERLAKREQATFYVFEMLGWVRVAPSPVVWETRA